MFHPLSKSGRKNSLSLPLLLYLVFVRPDSVSFAEFRRILQNHFVLSATGGNHRVAVFIAIDHDIDHDHDKTWQDYMRTDIKALCDCDAIYMLSNWRDSNGATIELQIANHLELDVVHQHRANPKI